MCDMRFARSSKWLTFILHHLVGDCDFLYKRPFRVVFRGFVMIRVHMVLHMNTRKLVTEFIGGEIPLHVFVGLLPVRTSSSAPKRSPIGVGCDEAILDDSVYKRNGEV
jgi:hypothetical protein